MRNIVMTGGTSGFGAITARLLLAEPETRLLLGTRGTPVPDGAEPLPLDLTRLDSVRAFAAACVGRLAGEPVDAVVLNAGLLRPDVAGRTPDGFETTFAVNHLSHYLLLRLLLDRLAPGAVVVLTTSGTHDPAERAGLPVPRHADAPRLAHPQDDDVDATPGVAGRRAYTASKLCAVLTARALRDGGRVLADLALARLRPPAGEYYAALRRGRVQWKQPSELARRDEVVRALWRDSAALVAEPVEATPGS